jgi:hypothetical protein
MYTPTHARTHAHTHTHTHDLAGDFVFLLGFPGHTMRYAPTSRLQYSDEVAVPAMIRFRA